MMTAMEIFERLYTAYGQPRWWSYDPYIVMVQSIMVQNTSWSSVEKVTAALGDALSPQRILALKTEELEELIRPCGFCKGKSAAIRRLTEWYGKYEYEARNVKAVGQSRLRQELLTIKGIGAETADVILVYAFYKPSFVIDAYTRRFLERLGFCFGNDDEIRSFFQAGLKNDFQLYGWYHWLILDHGIKHCRKKPVCGGCIFEAKCMLRKNGWQQKTIS